MGEGGWETSSHPYADKVKEGYRRLEEFFRLQDVGQMPDTAALLAGVPGVRLEPTRWEELAALAAEGTPEALGRLGRSPEQLRHYWGVRDGVIKRDYASVADYLNHAVFGLPSTRGADGRLVTPLPPGFGQARRTVWRDNDFPYLLEEGVCHVNLWSSQPLSAAEVEAEMAARLPPGSRTCWFVNPPVLQSVPAIWHAHIFWQQPGGGGGGSGGSGGGGGKEGRQQPLQ